MSVTVELQDNTSRNHADQFGDEPGETVRFWYELEPSGALCIRKVSTSPDTEFVDVYDDVDHKHVGGWNRLRYGEPQVEIVYGPAGWASVMGDTEEPTESGWPAEPPESLGRPGRSASQYGRPNPSRSRRG